MHAKDMYNGDIAAQPYIVTRTQCAFLWDIALVYGTNKMVNAFAFTHLLFADAMTMVLSWLLFVCIQFYCSLAMLAHTGTHNSITIFALLTNSQTIMIQSSFLGLSSRFSTLFSLSLSVSLDVYFVVVK